MRVLRGRLVLAMAAGSLAVVPTVNPRLTQTLGVRFSADGSPRYDKSVREYYMTADELGFIRIALAHAAPSSVGRAPRVFVTSKSGRRVQRLRRSPVLNPPTETARTRGFADDPRQSSRR